MLTRKFLMTTAAAGMLALSPQIATAEGEPIVGVDGYTVDGTKYEWNTAIADHVMKFDRGPKEPGHGDENDVYANILAHAEPGKEVRTSDNELIGKVVETRDYPHEGPVLIVDVTNMPNAPVKALGFGYETLNVMESGELQYGAEMDDLRELVLDKL